MSDTITETCSCGAALNALKQALDKHHRERYEDTQMFADALEKAQVYQAQDQDLYAAIDAACRQKDTAPECPHCGSDDPAMCESEGSHTHANFESPPPHYRQCCSHPFHTPVPDTARSEPDPNREAPFVIPSAEIPAPDAKPDPERVEKYLDQHAPPDDREAEKFMRDHEAPDDYLAASAYEALEQRLREAEKERDRFIEAKHLAHADLLQARTNCQALREGIKAARSEMFQRTTPEWLEEYLDGTGSEAKGHVQEAYENADDRLTDLLHRFPPDTEDSE